mgnify:CR=1 FL=1
MKLNQTSAIVHYFTNYIPYLKMCKEIYPTLPEGKSVLFYENCALAHINSASIKEEYPHRIYGDFEDMNRSKLIDQILEWTSHGILATGLCLQAVKYELGESQITIALVLSNILLSVPYLFDPTIRVGGDYIAYI